LPFTPLRQELGLKWWRHLVVMTPYNDTHTTTNKFTRVFRENTSSGELEWHRDRKDRTVHVVECNGWKFQYDNQIPKEIKKGDTLHIKANEYHRILKGQGSLVVEIVEHETSSVTK
jgi:hypothetical protein